MTVTDSGRRHVPHIVPAMQPGAPPPAPHVVPVAPGPGSAGTEELAFPMDVTVVSEPGRPRDHLVQALTTCSLLRVRVAVSLPTGGGGRAVLVPSAGPYGSDPAGVVRRGPWRPEPARSRVVVLRSASPARDVRAQVEAGESAPILVVSPESEEGEVVRTLQAGATSYLVDGQFSGTEILAAALGTAAGRSHLSPTVLAAVVRRLQHPDRTTVPTELASTLSRRERQIMDLVAEGHPNSAIARREFIAEKTVRNHLNNIYAKLGVRSRSEAILVWLGRSRPAHRPLGG